MRIFFSLFFSVLWAASATQAQHLLGIANSNYAGTNALYLNPAHIADNRYGFYWNLIGLQANVSNNALYYKGPNLISSAIDGTIDQLGSQNFPLYGGNRKRMIQGGAQARTPLSFMVQMSPKHSFAITLRGRGLVSVNQISQEVINIISAPNIDDISISEKTFNGVSINANAHVVGELGLTYSRVVMQEGKHFLKAGSTLKLLRGAGSFLQIKDINFIIKKDQPTGVVGQTQDIFQINSLDFSVGSSITDGASEVLDIIKAGCGFGADIGVVYEFRPRHEDYTYTMNGVEGLQDKRANKYLFKIGVSIMDLGGIKYGGASTQTFGINVKNRSLDEKNQNLITDNIDKPDSLAKAFGVPTVGFGKTFRAGLPTALNITADYCLTKHIYLNLTYIQNLRGKFAIGSRHAGLLAITPRMEFHGFELAVPISLQNNLSTLAVGTAIKLGPLFIGSDNLLGVFNVGKINGVDIYAGLSLPIRTPKKPKDRDLDGISDKLDACKDVAGVWLFKGCPDTDGDKIEDKEDDCPTEAGALEMKGCPDRDADKIADKDDACPDEAGLASLKGCPDKDKDGITDKEDECPETIGTLEFKGCPDTDGDKIQDKEDDCPTIAGLVEFQGCPDTDGDRIPDKEDDCPTEAGLPQFKGCPDTDTDGIMDKDDACPTVVGSKGNNGCPEVKNEAPILTQIEKDILKDVFENLEFEYGKATIAQKSQESLQALASILAKKTQYRLNIAGHTDNVGNAQTNLKLSQDRAKAVKTFLEKKGVPASQIISEGFGDKKPVADNKTEEGRTKNRRVEFKIIK